MEESAVFVAFVALLAFAAAAQAILVADMGQGMDPSMSAVAMLPIGAFAAGAALRIVRV